MQRSNKLTHRISALCCALAVGFGTFDASAEQSSELYTTAGHQYGRFEARIQFAFGDGVVSSFFLWKDGSELDSVFWNELDFEKLRANCELETNALYGDPESTHNLPYATEADLCGTFHTYMYEWTPEYIAWFLDGVEIRRETGETAAAYRDNTAEGMQLRFNIWPGDSSFGGEFDPAILPVHQYINWVQYSSYVDGAFQLEWREDFNGTSAPSGWSTGSWPSPKNLSTHSPSNVAFIDGYAVLSLTADDAKGSAGAMPMDPENGVPPAPSDTGMPPVVAPSASGGEVPAPQPSSTAVPTAPMESPTDQAESEGGCSYQVSGRSPAGSWLWIGPALVLLRLGRRPRPSRR